ncbi:MAG: DUF6588 family protein [Bacteroidota bacterium]
MRVRLPLLGLLVLGLAAPPAWAQSDLTETLEEVGEAYARAYVKPLADAIGADLNGALFHTAYAERLGFNLFIGVRTSALYIPDADQTFDLTFSGTATLTVDVGPDLVEVDVPATFEVRGAPTIFGEEAPPGGIATVRYDTTLSYLGLSIPVSLDTTITDVRTIGGLLKTSFAPLAVPHARLGSILGTDLIVRWLPAISVPDYGSVELIGLGLRHSMSPYLGDRYADIGLQVMWQRMQVDDDADASVITADAFAANLHLSRQWGPLILYTGLQVEESTVRFQYNFLPEDDRADIDPIAVDFKLSGGLKQRVIGGFTLAPGPLRLSAGVSVGELLVLSAGLGVAF